MYGVWFPLLRPRTQCTTISFSLGLRGREWTFNSFGGFPASCPGSALFSLLFYQAQCVSHKVSNLENLIVCKYWSLSCMLFLFWIWLTPLYNYFFSFKVRRTFDSSLEKKESFADCTGLDLVFRMTFLSLLDIRNEISVYMYEHATVWSVRNTGITCLGRRK